MNISNHDIDEARSELGAALIIALPSDEPAILRHIAAAYLRLGGELSPLTIEKLREQLPELRSR